MAVIQSHHARFVMPKCCYYLTSQTHVLQPQKFTTHSSAAIPSSAIGWVSNWSGVPIATTSRCEGAMKCSGRTAWPTGSFKFQR